MKKIYSMLHDEKVQGNLIIATIFVVVLAVVILTWGK